LLRLDSPLPTAGNEDNENVRIVEEKVPSQSDNISLTIPAYGFVLMFAGE